MKGGAAVMVAPYLYDRTMADVDVEEREDAPFR